MFAFFWAFALNQALTYYHRKLNLSRTFFKVFEVLPLFCELLPLWTALADSSDILTPLAGFVKHFFEVFSFLLDKHTGALGRDLPAASPSQAEYWIQRLQAANLHCYTVLYIFYNSCSLKRLLSPQKMAFVSSNKIENRMIPRYNDFKRSAPAGA